MPKKKGGQPNNKNAETWTEAKKLLAVDLIFARLEEGESLREILSSERDKKALPSRKTFFEWVNNDDFVSDQYARACELRADKIFEEIMDIADDSSNDVIISDNGSVKMNSEFVQRSRLRVDARKWILSKMNPKKYGESTKIDHTVHQGVKSIPISLDEAPKEST